ncbi:recombination protein RecR [Patescibacteria group bacterium]|nr:recombination protein RecR [Patescibacteria group bacterium]
MPKYPDSIQKCIDGLAHLPGIGPKSAERIVFYLLKQGSKTSDELAKNIGALQKNISLCQQCGNMTDQNPCLLCTDTKRDDAIICVVAEPQDIQVIEKSGEFHGRYHVLGGVLNPVEGMTADRLRIKELVDRIKKNKPALKEIIIATNPDLEGESTAMYLARQLKPYQLKISRLAKGLPMGATIEYADEITISNALKGRQEV